MRLPLSGASLAVLATLALSCGSRSSNPFLNDKGTVAPRASARLVFTSSAWRTSQPAPLELFAAGADGSDIEQLTRCNTDTLDCTTQEAVSAPDRQRMAVRRVYVDTNRDGSLSSLDAQSLLLVDLGRGLEAALQPPNVSVSGVDWSSDGALLLYSASGAGGLEDIFQIDPSGQNNANVTGTADASERRPRFDPSGQTAAFERIDSTGKGRIAYFSSSSTITTVTTGGEGTEALTGTPYVVGSDADPAWSPDAKRLVFRRCTGRGKADRGTWEVLTVALTGGAPTTIASGARYRGAPDWGPEGIVFVEEDGSGNSQLVLVQPDGSGRKALVSVGTNYSLGFPRFLPPAP